MTPEDASQILQKFVEIDQCLDDLHKKAQSEASDCTQASRSPYVESSKVKEQPYPTSLDGVRELIEKSFW